MIFRISYKNRRNRRRIPTHERIWGWVSQLSHDLQYDFSTGFSGQFSQGLPCSLIYGVENHGAACAISNFVCDFKIENNIPFFSAARLPVQWRKTSWENTIRMEPYCFCVSQNQIVTTRALPTGASTNGVLQCILISHRQRRPQIEARNC